MHIYLLEFLHSFFQVSAWPHLPAQSGNFTRNKTKILDCKHGKAIKRRRRTRKSQQQLHFCCALLLCCLMRFSLCFYGCHSNGPASFAIASNAITYRRISVVSLVFILLCSEVVHLLQPWKCNIVSDRAIRGDGPVRGHRRCCITTSIENMTISMNVGIGGRRHFFQLGTKTQSLHRHRPCSTDWGVGQVQVSALLGLEGAFSSTNT